MAVRTLNVVHARGVTPSTVHVLYVVPAGHTLIVKDVRLANPTGAAAALNLVVRRGTTVISLLRQSVAPTTTVAIAGAHVVLEPGDELAIVSDTADIQLHASGSLLVGTAESA